MIAVSETWKNSIYEKRKSLKIRAEVSLLTGNTIYLDYDDKEDSYQDSFMASGVSFADATSKESTFDIGQAVMNTFSFRLNNFGERFSNIIFENAVITPYVGMELPDGTTEWIKKGVFNISDPGKRGNVLSFTAYDNMQKMEKPFASVNITYPISILAMVQKICDFCGVALKTSFRNCVGIIHEAPAGSNHSCRQMISYIAQITGNFAKFDANGDLEISWYESDESKFYNLDVYKNLEVNTKDIEVTGVNVTSYYNESSPTDKNGDPVIESSTIGSAGFIISIKNNPLIPYGHSLSAARMLSFLIGVKFRPLTLTTFYDPALEAGDTVKITDVKGNSYVFFVTNLTATLGSDVKIICGSETTQENEASKYTGSSQAILAILEATNAKFKDLITDKMEALVGEFGFMKTDEADIKYSTIEQADILQANINAVSGNLASFISGEFEALKSKEAIFENTTTEKFTAQQASIDEVSGNLASFISGEFEALKSKEAEFENTATQNFTAVNAQIETVTGDLADYKVVIAGQFTAYDADILSLKARDSELETAVIGKASIGDLEALRTRTGILESDYSALATIVNGNLTSENIHSLVIAGEKFTIADGFIKNAMIESLVFEKITGVDIDTTSVKVHSKDGKSSWIDNTIQISDTNRVRVQMGKDASGDYTLAVWDAAGKLIWDALGATENTIQRAIIRDAAVADDANISGSKLDIESVVREVNGATTKLKSTAILLDEKKQTLDVAFNLMENTVSDNLVMAKNYTDSMFDSVQIGGRNLIRNSRNLIFDDYYFDTHTITVIDDGEGNITLIGLTATYDGNGTVTLVGATAMHDGAETVTITR